MPAIITPGAMTCKPRFGGNWGYFDDLLGRLTLALRGAERAERSDAVGVPLERVVGAQLRQVCGRSICILLLPLLSVPRIEGTFFHR
jgi:hypothetical protein